MPGPVEKNEAPVAEPPSAAPAVLVLVSMHTLNQSPPTYPLTCADSQGDDASPTMSRGTRLLPPGHVAVDGAGFCVILVMASSALLDHEGRPADQEGGSGAGGRGSGSGVHNRFLEALQVARESAGEGTVGGDGQQDGMRDLLLYCQPSAAH